MVQELQTSDDYQLTFSMPLIQSKSIADQVEEVLRERIRDATYLSGSRIPSESDLAEELGVSRATIRTVLAKLAVNGLILRKQGDGTYVNARAKEVSAHLGNIWDFVYLIESNGFKASIQPLSVNLKPATEKEAIALAIESGDELVSMRRLFYADDKPVILASNVTPAALLRVPIEQISANMPIREIFRIYYRQEIAFAITDIRSTMVGEEIKDLLGDGSNKTVLELQLAFYSKNNQPIALGINYFDDAVLRLSLVQAWS